MGIYVNPQNESKEAFLHREGEQKSFYNFDYDKVPDNKLPVVLADNGSFTAAGVCYSKSEYEAFTQPDDPRPKKLFLVDIDKLIPVSDECLKKYATQGARE